MCVFFLSDYSFKLWLIIFKISVYFFYISYVLFKSNLVFFAFVFELAFSHVPKKCIKSQAEGRIDADVDSKIFSPIAYFNRNFKVAACQTDAYVYR